MLRKIVFLLLITGAAFGQSLPDAPSASKRKQPDYNPHLRWGQVVKAKPFWISHSVALASVVYDVEATHQGLAHHRCVEGNTGWGVGPRPSRGALYRRDLAQFGIVFVVDAILGKTISPWVTLGPAGAVSERHFVGGSRWLTQCW